MATKNYFIILLSATLFFQCNRQEREELQSRVATLEEAESQLRQEVQQQIQQEDSMLANFMESMSGIEDDLGEIRARELNIQLTKKNDLSPKDLGEQIRQDIQAIDSLLTKNKQVIKQLNARLRASLQEKGQLSTTATELKENLEQQLEEREQNLITLKTQLEEVQTTVVTLQTEVDSLIQLNEEKANALNTAYFVTGDFKNLKEEEILDKKGGFLGIFGGVKTLNDDFDPDKFTRIDIRETNQFSVEGKDVTLVTVHPSDSYEIDKEDSGEKVNLVVSDPEKFWESSKYMVMQVK